MTSQLFSSVGLVDVIDNNLNGVATFESPANYWDIFSDVAGPIMQALNSEPQEIIDDVKMAVVDKAEKLLKNNMVHTDWEAIIISGNKK